MNPDKRKRRPAQDAASRMIARSGCTRASQYAPDCRRCGDSAACCFGLSEAELWAEATRLVFEQGWDLDEVRGVLALPGVIS